MRMGLLMELTQSPRQNPKPTSFGPHTQRQKSKLSLMRITRRLKGKDLNEDGPPNGAYPITQTESKAHQLWSTHGRERRWVERQDATTETGRRKLNEIRHSTQRQKSKLSLMIITRRLKGKDLNEDGPPNGAYPITQTESKAHQLRSTHGRERRWVERQDAMTVDRQDATTETGRRNLTSQHQHPKSWCLWHEMRLKSKKKTTKWHWRVN
jgi:hypothetical protein